MQMVEWVVEAAGGSAKVVAGVGSNDTRTCRGDGRAQPRDAGADALLLVSPVLQQADPARLESRTAGPSPTRPTCRSCSTTFPAARAYRSPPRPSSSSPRHPESGVKDAKGDLWAASHVMAATDCCGSPAPTRSTLPHLAQGATGIVSVVGHVAGRRYAEMVAAVDAGDLATAPRASISTSSRSSTRS
jgi:4-hydroxy-tetrahydrodipicolinate synthase